nr:immunoglobulin light chain junction region [Macaca mulatta]MOV72244.1 immunoglobulin light chain junction region [Macaca mulatta]MOV72256.1 immunoglobulin light chain junction region [Macaca mulatta]MOV72342.1 immunoglobulin light chain junction region [Macaca mulatta]MOV72731.1 immunoglobulin light chain junction region [Macaca mulatta]
DYYCYSSDSSADYWVF